MKASATRAAPPATLARDAIASLADLKAQTQRCREIALVRPQALVALGSTAARSLMGRAVPVTAEGGRWLARQRFAKG